MSSSEAAQASPTVAVLGAGLMGHGIAQVFMAAGSNVRVWDPHPDALGRVVARIESHLQLMDLEIEVTVELTSRLEDAVTGADLVIEAAPEGLTLKREIVTQLDQHAPDTIIASNTSVLRISEIAEGSANPARIVGTHWWNPPYLMPLVEVVRGDQTSDETVATVTQWLSAAGKTPVTVNIDAPGFVGNRMQFALWREAAHLVENGICDAETVDLVARLTFGRRLSAMGPLENADFIGLDLTSSIMDYLSPDLSTTQSAPQLFRTAVEGGNLGAKSGQGVYIWEDGKREKAESRLLEHLLSMAARPHDQESALEG